MNITVSASGQVASVMESSSSDRTVSGTSPAKDGTSGGNSPTSGGTGTGGTSGGDIGGTGGTSGGDTKGSGGGTSPSSTPTASPDSTTGSSEDAPGSAGLNSINELANEVNDALNEAGIIGNFNNLGKRVISVSDHINKLDLLGDDVIDKAAGAGLDYSAASTAKEAFKDDYKQFFNAWKALEAAVARGSTEAEQKALLQKVKEIGQSLKLTYPNYSNAVSFLQESLASR
jgi:hypothetical protein